MPHHIVYWEMTKREMDVDDAELFDLRQHERAGELYIESMDGQRMPRIWDHALSDWVLATQEEGSSSADARRRLTTGQGLLGVAHTPRLPWATGASAPFAGGAARWTGASCCRRSTARLSRKRADRNRSATR